jgi:hypothetical protein
MINSTPTQLPADEWQSCKGEVGQLVHRLRWQRRSTQLRRGALLATLAMLTVGGNYYYSDVATELSVKASGSPCDHYSQELRAYFCDKSISDLDPSFWEHFSKCPDCRREFKFFGGISHTHLAHVSNAQKRAETDGTTHHISLDELLKQATFAARH